MAATDGKRKARAHAPRKIPGNIAQGLAAATCSLLGTAAAMPVAAEEEPQWEFDTALLYYGESDDRVRDLSLNVLARRLFMDDKVLSLGLVYDSLTGASPSGAIPQNEVQTFTRPSGEAVYSVAPGELPLDDTFLDTRYALTVGWQQPIGRLYTGSAGISFSTEYDYTHTGVNFGIARDFNKRNTTVSLGAAIARDELDPEGGAPLPLAAMGDLGDLSSRRAGTEEKDVLDLLFGVTQVINEKFLVQINYSLSDSSGYLNDPYKILSVVDPATGNGISRTPVTGTGPLHEYRFESRPDQRVKHSLYMQGKYYMDGKVLDMSWRYMTDDWGIDSHTLDAKFRWPLGERSWLEPHLRFYTQTEADFYRASLPAGELPAFASADYRLAAFDAITAGIKYGWYTSSGNELAVRLEYYRQDGEIPPDELFGDHTSEALYPGLDAVILNFSYGFDL
ncbi:MAG TPA: DUF3570 domain-containing protein [Woeseiaceae bacterium]|nr:DUF3570 domain-containing protein [Woeseiaceae bacterium]